MSEESMFERAIRKIVEPDTVRQPIEALEEPDTVRGGLESDRQEGSDTISQSPAGDSAESLMGDEFVDPEYVPETMLGAWKAIMFETADGQKYIAHRAQEDGYLLTRLSVDKELDGAPITITKEQARHILVVEKKQFICDDLTLDVARIVEKMGK